jgi:opacity protein-like surface antigen
MSHRGPREECNAMRRAIKSVLLTGAIALVLAPIQARADGFVIPWVGTAFGTNINNGRTTFGVDAGGMGAGVIGGEVDFGYNPSFFGNTSDFGHNTIINLMGNVIVGIPVGGQRGPGIRPYVVGGIGLVRTQVDGGTLLRVSSSDNMFGWDAGGGVMGYFSDHVGLRGDLRYVRGTHDLATATDSTPFNIIDFNSNKLHFWRASIGVVFR